MTTTRIRVRGSDQRAVIAVGAATGVGLALEGLQPTGSAVVDWMLLILASAGAVWAAASAPWWALSAMAGVAAAIAPTFLPLAIGVLVLAFSLAIGSLRRSQPVERAIVAGGAMLVLSLARELRWFGINTLIALTLVIGVAVLGIWRRSNRDRRLVLQTLGGIAAFTAIACLGLLMAATSARGDLSEGNRVARQGLQELKSGEFELARQSFGRAAEAFERADRDMSALWAQPARLIPVANQHRKVGADLSATAAEATRVIAEQLRFVDLDALRIVDGAIDIEAVKALQPPLIEVQRAVNELDQAVASSNNGWLAGPVERRVVDLADELDEQLSLGDKSLAALQVAPALLGENGQRVYFVMFTTPAEARGQGGFMGNYAELTVTNGEIEMTAFGRTGELSSRGASSVLTRPTEWLLRYGPFGFQKGPDRLVGPVAWSNITMSPHFPSTAQVVADLYPQSGGREIGGVINLDVYALQELVGVVGPLDISGIEGSLTGTNAAQFLLVDQYELDQSTRVDLLEDVARQVVTLVLAGSVDDPLQLGQALATPAQQGRLFAWSSVAAEQDLLRRIGIDGALFALDAPATRMSVRVVNASGNKIDTYLERRVCVAREVDSNQISATVQLINHAPASGLPPIVIGNLVELPDGFNRTYLTWHSTLLVDSATIDGQPLALQPQIEQGANAYSAYVDVPPNGQVELRFVLDGEFPSLGASGATTIAVSPQPLVMPELWATTSSPNQQCADADFVAITKPGEIDLLGQK